MSTIDTLPSDFAGGSSDWVEDAIEALDKSERPYLLLTTGRLPGVRVTSNLTPNARLLFRRYIESGALADYCTED